MAANLLGHPPPPSRALIAHPLVAWIFCCLFLGGVIECNYFVYLPIWGLMSRSRGDSADDPADEDPRLSLASPGLW